MKTNKDYTLYFRDYGQITVPKGTKVTHMTALGLDPKYHFVDEYGWIYRDYPKISTLLKFDVEYYGLDVPVEFVDVPLTEN